MSDPLAQRILDLIYRDPETQRKYKESITNWILDTQPRTGPLESVALLRYLATHQPDVLQRLKINIYLQDDLAQALGSLDLN